MRYKKIIEELYTKEECAAFIRLGEEMGFEESLVRTKQGEVMDKSFRDNDRVVFDNPELANDLWSRIKDKVPQEFNGWTACGLNERLRYYRYKDGQQFKPHIDGAFKRDENEVSMITLLIYLNEDFEGGETMFVLEFESIKPKTGMVLLFEHKLLHSGRPVLSGVKYVLRTDVMYKKNI